MPKENCPGSHLFLVLSGNSSNVINNSANSAKTGDKHKSDGILG